MWRTKWLIFRKNVDWKSRIWVRNCRLLWQRKLGHRAGHVISVFAVSYLKWPHWSPHWVFNSAHAKCMMNQSTIWKCRKCLTYWHAYVKRFTIFVSWKPIVITLGAEKSIFPELSPANLSAADPDQIRYTWTRQGVTTFREFLARSAHFGQNGGWDESHGARVYFCVVIQRTFRQLDNGRFSPNLVTKRSSVSRRGIQKDIFQNFHFRGHLPQNLKSKIGQTGTSLRAGYRSWDALQRDAVYSML